MSSFYSGESYVLESLYAQFYLNLHRLQIFYHQSVSITRDGFPHSSDSSLKPSSIIERTHVSCLSSESTFIFIESYSRDCRGCSSFSSLKLKSKTLRMK